MFPSPTHSGRLTVQLPAAASGQVRLLNSVGQVVRQLPLRQQSQLTLSTQGLPAGLYSVRIEADGSQATRRVVLE